MDQCSVTVPTVLPQRQSLVSELLSQLGMLWPQVPVTVSPHNPGQPPRVDFVRALQRGARFGRRWIVYLEDDAYLAPVCPYVVADRLREADASGHRLVSFYSDNRRVLKAMAEGRSSVTLPARYLWSTVCVAVRADDVPAIADFAPGWYDRHPQHWHASDLLLRDFLKSSGSDVLVAVPSPVQHRSTPSTLGHDAKHHRFSRSFRRAYGQAPRISDGGESDPNLVFQHLELEEISEEFRNSP
jgi:hypothetical protein